MMEKKDEIYDNLREMLSNIPDNYKILEETIDIEVQKEYFESSKEVEINPDEDILSEMIDALSNQETDVDNTKLLLQKLALIDSVEAFRAIEKYAQAPLSELKEWSILALQQSKMVMHCSLLEEQQVFISTGLGGKNDKLRYMLVFPYNHNVHPINTYQSDSLQKELHYFLSKEEGEVEEITIEREYATAIILLPLKAPVSEIIKDIIIECNQLGNFLSHNVMITNMKHLTHEEITQIIYQHEEE